MGMSKGQRQACNEHSHTLYASTQASVTERATLLTSPAALASLGSSGA